MYWWRRWAQFSACAGASPWIRDAQPGVGCTPIEFLVRWALTARTAVFCHYLTFLCDCLYPYIGRIRRFSAYGPSHSRGAQSRKIEGRSAVGGACKKTPPFNTDLLRWLKRHIPALPSIPDNYKVALLWVEILLGFFFCLRISEILALTEDDVKILHETAGMTLSILIRESGNDQENRGVTRVLSSNKTARRPPQSAFCFTQHRTSSGNNRNWPPPSFL